MFFYLSKILWVIISPINFIVISCIIMLIGLMKAHGGVLEFFRFYSLFLITALSILFVFPVGDRLLHPWERQYMPVTELPEKVDGIIVLGGEIDPYVSDEMDQISTSTKTYRLYALPGLMRAYPQAKIVFSGGSGNVRGQNKREADVAQRLLQEWGVKTDNIIFERDSRNTYENAVFSKKIVDPKPDETWLLVTSANHMPRSAAVFNAVDWKVTPYPVNYRAGLYRPVLCFCAADNLDKIQILAHEVIGLIIYRVTGKAQ